MPNVPADAGKDLQKEMLATYYRQLETANADGVPVAYLFIPGNLVELTRAFGYVPVYPEINALQCGIKKVAGQNIAKAEDLGYSSDVCGYVKNDIGLMLSDRQSPFAKLPKPDLLVCNYSGCNTFLKWYEALAHFYGAELVIVDLPYLRAPETHDMDVHYVVEQLWELIRVCEERTGVSFSMAELQRTLALSRQAEELWTQILQLARERPSPFDSYFEAVFYMAPINMLRGTEETVTYYRYLLEEMKARREAHRGPVPEEKFRTVVEGPPPWPHFRAFWELFKRWGAVSVASTYSKVGGLYDQGVRHDPGRPLESIAEYAMGGYTNWNLRMRADLLRRYVDTYDADALVIHSVKSCRSFSVGQADFREWFANELGIPTLMVESDLADPRYFQEAQLRNRIDAFFESLQQRRLAGVTA